jgi:hypothetical protein
MYGTDHHASKRAPFRVFCKRDLADNEARYEFEKPMSSLIVLIGLKPVTGPVTD